MLAAQERWQKSASQHTFYSVTEIFRQGDMPQAVWFINSGGVKLVRLEPEGQQLIINLRSAGRWLGLASAIKQARYDFPALPLTKCSLQCLPIRTFRQILKTDLEFAGRIAQALAIRIAGEPQFTPRSCGPACGIEPPRRCAARRSALYPPNPRSSGSL
jgi:CRP-like cAMP-binding protein